MRNLALLWSAIAVLAMGACGEQAPEQALPTPADTVDMALAEYDPAAFDTITWETPEEALVRGSVVFSVSCRKCHGPQGYGDGGFVAAGDTLRPPSFHGPDWRFREDHAGLTRQIFIGTTEGMPHWGLTALSLRDIDAVAQFIQLQFAAN